MGVKNSQNSTKTPFLENIPNMVIKLEKEFGWIRGQNNYDICV